MIPLLSVKSTALIHVTYTWCTMVSKARGWLGTAANFAAIYRTSPTIGSCTLEGKNADNDAERLSKDNIFSNRLNSTEPGKQSGS